VSKIASLEAVRDHVQSGQTVALGGAWMSNHPMAAVRELVRAHIGDLHVVDNLASLDVDLLIGAGLVRELTFSMVSLESFGLAPHFRRAVEHGTVEITELSGIALNLAIDAAARNLPFLPMRDLGASEIPDHQPEHYTAIVCPFTGEPLLAVRAIKPDVVLIHALRADPEGNCQFDGTLAIDPELARAGTKVIVTCEEIVAREVIAERPDSTAIPGFLVDVVIEAPLGAHPTSHVPSYGLDAWSVMDYVQACRGGDGDWSAYLAQIAGESEEEYRERVVPSRRRRVLHSIAQRGEILTRESPESPESPMPEPEPVAGAMDDPSWRIEELMVCCVAGEIDDSGVTVLGSFTPLAYAAYMMAKLTHARDAWVVGFNAIGIPAMELNLTSVEAQMYRAAIARWGFIDTTCTVHLGGRGLIECVSPAQVDGDGSINTSVIGPDYRHPKIRLPGGAGAPEVVQHYKKIVVYVGRHDRRTLVEKVDFRTGGRRPIGASARRERNLLAGPIRIVTPLAVMTKDYDDRPFRLDSAHPGVEVDQIIANTGFELVVPSRVPCTPEPTPAQLALLRDRIDPFGTICFDLMDGASRTDYIRGILDREWKRADLALTPA
jgi:acyl CoA:acetate/3-ketoacid CoA transferase alpha subunit/acyl CoA:acetate/3-ketoacid CoA transferase beta subunit